MIDRASIHQLDPAQAEVKSSDSRQNEQTGNIEKKVPPEFQHIDTSSITNETTNLRDVERRILQGSGTDVYELAQNMASYGNEIPDYPPRILFKLQNGSEVVYSGKASIEAIQEPIVEISFTSFGPSMVPDDIITFQHSGGDKSLGVHGRGMTYALSIWTLLQGLDVTVSSHWNNARYEGKCLAIDGNRPGTKKFAFGYNILPDSADAWSEKSQETRVSVKGENLSFVLNSLRNLDEVFLPANKEYYAATLVPREQLAKSPIEKQVVWEVDGHPVSVECLPESDAQKNQVVEPDESIFVGGLKVETYFNFAFRWAIWGGEHIKSDSRKMISRSENSLMAQGAYREAIVKLIRNTESIELLEKLLDLNERFNDVRFIPSELSQSLDRYGTEEFMKINPATTELLRKLLLMRYKVLPILAQNPAEAARLRPVLAEGEKLLISNGAGFSEMLRAAGCTEANTKLGLKSSETKGDLVVIAPDKEILAKVLDDVVGTGKIAFDEDENGNCKITISDSLKIDTLDLNSFNQLPLPWTITSNLLYTIGYFDAEKCSVTLRVIKPEGVYTHSFIGSQYNDEAGRSRERSFGVKTEFEPLKSDVEATIELLIKPRTFASKEQVEELHQLYANLPRMLSSERDKKLKDLTYEELTEHLRKEKEEKLKKEKAEQKLDVLKLTVSRMLKGEITPALAMNLIQDAKNRTPENESASVREGFSLGVERLNRPAEVRFRVTGQGYGVPLGGYFKEGSADTLKFNGRKVEWTQSAQKYEKLEGLKKAPEHWTLATHVKLKLTEWTTIPIRVDITDVTFVDQKGLEVEVDSQSGAVRARGVSEEVPFYQRKGNKKNSEGIPVNDHHKEAFIRAENLDWGLAEPLVQNRDSDLSLRDKAIMALSIHQKTFIYDDDPNTSIHVESGNKSEADFVKRLLEAGRGTCNYAATRACLMLRLSGVPAYVEGGAVSTGKISTDAETHLWIRFWNGKKWERAETTNGSINPNVTLYTSGSVSGNGEVRSLSGLLQADTNPTAWKEAVKYEATSTLEAILLMGKATANIPRSIMRLITNKESREKTLFSLRRNNEILPVITNALWLMAMEKLESTAHRAVEKQLNKLTAPPEEEI